MNIANINFVNPKRREELSKNIGEYGKNLFGGEKQEQVLQGQYIAIEIY